jgi:hypothetical protein
MEGTTARREGRAKRPQGTTQHAATIRTQETPDTRGAGGHTEEPEETPGGPGHTRGIQEARREQRERGGELERHNSVRRTLHCELYYLYV